jgi:hypothetical protein
MNSEKKRTATARQRRFKGRHVNTRKFFMERLRAPSRESSATPCPRNPNPRGENGAKLFRIVNLIQRILSKESPGHVCLRIMTVRRTSYRPNRVSSVNSGRGARNLGNGRF